MTSYYSDNLHVDQDRVFGGFQKLLLPAVKQFGMLVEASEGMGKSWLAQKFRQFCQEVGSTYPVSYLDFADRRGRHNIQTAINLIELVAKEVGRPSDFPTLAQALRMAAGDSQAPELQQLVPAVQKLYANLRPNDLKILVPSMGVRFEDIIGDGSMPFPRQVQAVVHYFFRLGRVPELIETIPTLPTMQNANVDWWQGLEHLRSAPPESENLHAGEQFTTDQGSVLHFNDERGRSQAERQINDAFFQDLEVLAQNQGTVVLIFDGYDAAPLEAQAWIEQELFDRLERAETKMIVIVSGRTVPPLSDIRRQRIVAARVDPLEPQYVREYLIERRGFSPTAILPTLITMTPPEFRAFLEEQHHISLDPQNPAAATASDQAALDEFILAILQISIRGSPKIMADIAGNVTAQQQRHDPFFDDVPG
jgi:hypothetical protein